MIERFVPILLEDSPGGGIESTILMIGGMFVIFYLIVIRPQSKQNRARQAMIAALKKNDRIITTGGIFGTVSGIQDDVVTLTIDESQKVRIKVSRASIGTVVKEGEEETATT